MAVLIIDRRFWITLVCFLNPMKHLDGYTGNAELWISIPEYEGIWEILEENIWLMKRTNSLRRNHYFATIGIVALGRASLSLWHRIILVAVICTILGIVDYKNVLAPDSKSTTFLWLASVFLAPIIPLIINNRMTWEIQPQWELKWALQRVKIE